MEAESMRCAECGIELELHQVGGGVFVTWGNAPHDFKPMKVWCRLHMTDRVDHDDRLVDLVREEAEELRGRAETPE
jgi:hypothetical protein